MHGLNQTQIENRPIQLIDVKASGRYGVVWRAKFKHDEVAVKVFQDEKSWDTEQRIFMVISNHTEQREANYINDEFGCLYIAVAADESPEHFGIYRRRKAFGSIGILANHRIPQLRLVVRILESPHRNLAGIVQDCRIDGSRTYAFARRNTSIEDGKIEASRRSP